MSDLIRLKYAETNDINIDGMYGQLDTRIQVKVKNVTPAKSVWAHFPAGGGVWQDLALPWIANYGNYDLFGVDPGYIITELVVACTQAGITDWDNNGFANYLLGDNSAVAGDDVVLNQAQAQQGTEVGGGFEFQTSWIVGSILVNNLSYAKRVGIRYTTNQGATWNDTLATYGGPLNTDSTTAGPGSAEQWNFTTPELNYDNSSATFEFAVYYQRLDTGEWFWDNNFSQNYQLSKATGSTIQ
jgi:hypothetical protein